MRSTRTIFFVLLSLAACGEHPPALIPFEVSTKRTVAELPEHTRARGVVLVLIDTLRADHVELTEGTGLTPQLASLAEQGVAFSNAYTTSSWTRPAVGSLFTGRYPSEVGLHCHEDSIPEGAITLAECLRAHGVRTLAVSANTNAGSKWGFERGFEEFVEPERSVCYEGDERGMVPAEVVTREGLRLLEGLGEDESFFLFLHYTDPHDPYFLHEELSGPAPAGPFDGSREELKRLDRLGTLERSKAEDRIKFLYRSEVQYVDQWVGHLVGALRDRALFDESLFVLTSDHGEGLWDHGERAHGKKLFEEQVHIPLVVSFPRGWGRSRTESDELVSLIDIAPTALAAMGVEKPAAWHGGDLWRVALRGEPIREHAFAEIDRVGVYYQALRRGTWKSLRNSAHDTVFQGREHIVREGDTTWTIAYLYYGPGHMKILTEANPEVFLTGVPLSEVELEIGTALAIPPMPIPEYEGFTELFDLVADPGEAHGVSPADTTKAQEFHARARGLRVWAEQQARQAAGPAPEALDEETRAALRGLGYVE